MELSFGRSRTFARWPRALESAKRAVGEYDAVVVEALTGEIGGPRRAAHGKIFVGVGGEEAVHPHQGQEARSVERAG